MPENKIENKLEHPCFPQPIDPNIKVWRYIDTSKFIDILARKSLYLSRLDLLGDSHEGSRTKTDFLSIQKLYNELNAPAGINFSAERLKRDNQYMFVNCWYCDNNESEAMWKLYCPDNKGVAIQTTYKKLVDSVDHDNYVYIGAVTYIDYETEWYPTGNGFYPVMHKRKAFQHEKEIRLVKWEHISWINKTQSPYGLYCPWDMESCAENIFVNPYAQAWYYEVIKDVVNKYQCNLNIEWSTMKSEPYY